MERAGGNTGREPRAWHVYLTLGLFATAAYFFLPTADAQDVLTVAVAASAAGAVVAGTSLLGSRRPLPWYLFAAGLLMFVLGDAVWAYFEVVLGIESPFPSTADAFYLAGYPFIVAGLLLTQRRELGRDRVDVADPLIVATGVGLLSWVFLINPRSHDAAVPLLERLVSIAYPLMDVLLLAALTRVLFLGGRRSPAYRLLGASLAIMLASDTVFAGLELAGTYETGNPVDAGFLISYVLFGTAGLHPSMADPAEPAYGDAPRLTRRRLVLLASASLTAPVVLVIQVMRDEPVDLVVVAGGAAVLFLLVLGRMAGITRSRERATDRERILRASGSALVSAIDRRGVYEAGIEAAHELTGGTPAARVSLAVGQGEHMSVVASTGGGAEEMEGGPFDVGSLPEPHRRRFLGELPAEVTVARGGEVRKALGLAREEKVFFAVPLFVRGELRGAIWAAGRSPLSAEGKDGLAILGSQISLALESLALAEEIHRRRSEERFRSLIRNSSDIITVADADGAIVYQSPAVERVLGYRPEEMLGEYAFSYVHPEDLERVFGKFSEGLKNAGPTFEPVEYRFRHADGSWRWLEGIGNNLLADPDVRGVVVNSRDVTERKEAEEALKESEERFRSAFEDASIGVALISLDNRYLRVNRAFCEMLGYAEGELIGKTSFEVTHPGDREKSRARTEVLVNGRSPTLGLEKRYVRKDGSIVWALSDVSLVRGSGDEPTHFVGQYQDVTERKVLERRLEHQAFHDSVTGLPNRALFADRLEHALHRRDERGNNVAVLFVDLDNFKYVNDTMGHQMGDGLLVAVSERLRGCLRPADTAARLGGDEFAVLLEDVEGVGEATGVAGRIVEELRASFVLGGQEVYATLSIGIALGVPGRDSPHALLSNADVAMYRAKEEGKARYWVYDPSMQDELVERMRLENLLRGALERDEFGVRYQPVVALGTGRLMGFEALLCWEHPERGSVSPSEFVPLAEEIGLDVPIGRRVLRKACRQRRRWRELCPEGATLTIGVNLSARQLRHPGLLEDVDAALKEGELEPRELVLEITEGAVIGHDEQHVDALKKLRDMGVRLAIDDFGTGYSSLSYLRRLPVDSVKIDRSFVGDDEGDGVLLEGVVGIAHGLGLEVVAEGVETAEQLARVRSLGCDLAQGFLFSGPLSAEQAAAFLKEDHRG